MRVSRLYSNITTSVSGRNSSAGTGGVVSTVAGDVSSRTAQSAAPEQDVLNNINQPAYNAMNEFLYLTGQERNEAYRNLHSADKDKFLKILQKISKDGSDTEKKLASEGVAESEGIASDYERMRLNGFKRYGESGALVSPYN
jgi:hypothetical protein